MTKVVITKYVCDWCGKEQTGPYESRVQFEGFAPTKVMFDDELCGDCSIHLDVLRQDRIEGRTMLRTATHPESPEDTL